MTVYHRKVQYYETDRMGIVHHSNFIRWFEEARIDYLEKLGTPYPDFEKSGLMSPVLSVECRYKKPVHFGEFIDVETRLTEFGRVRFAFFYRVTGKDGEVHAEGKTEHCFVDQAGRPVALCRRRPELAALFEAQLETVPDGRADTPENANLAKL